MEKGILDHPRPQTQQDEEAWRKDVMSSLDNLKAISVLEGFVSSFQTSEGHAYEVHDEPDNPQTIPTISHNSSLFLTDVIFSFNLLLRDYRPVDIVLNRLSKPTLC